MKWKHQRMFGEWRTIFRAEGKPRNFWQAGDFIFQPMKFLRAFLKAMQ